MFYSRNLNGFRSREKFCSIAGISAATAATVAGTAISAGTSIAGATSGGKSGSSSTPTTSTVPTYDTSLITSQQQDANTKAANQSVRLSNVNTITPYGTSTYNYTTDTAAYNKAMDDWNAKQAAADAENKQNSDNATYNYNLMKQMGSGASQYYKSVGNTVSAGAKPNEADYQIATNTQTLSPAQQALLDQQNANNSKANQNTSAIYDVAAKGIGGLEYQLDPKRLQEIGITSKDVTNALGKLDTSKMNITPAMLGSALAGLDGSKLAINSNDVKNAWNNTANNKLAINANDVKSALAGMGQSNLAINSQDVKNALSRLDPNSKDYIAGRDKTVKAILSRTNPQMQIQRNAMNTRLANAGITPGSEAWYQEMKAQGQNENDLSMQAELAGNQEQNTLFNQGATAYDKTLAGNNQLYNQASNTYGQTLAGESALQDQANTAFNNTLSGNNQLYNQNLNNYNATLNGQNQEYNQNLNNYNATLNGNNNLYNQALTGQQQYLTSVKSLYSPASQFTLPTYQGYSGATVQPANVLGAYELNNNSNTTNANNTNTNNRNTYNQVTGTNNANKSALSSLGSSGISALSNTNWFKNLFNSSGTNGSSIIGGSYGL